MRVYLPATFSMLRDLEENQEITARSGGGFTVTDGLRDLFDFGEEEEFEEIAFDLASEASLRLLAIGDEEKFPHRRVVISVDVDDSTVTPNLDYGEGVVALQPATVALDKVAAIHIDVEESEEATAKAVQAIDAAELGDEDAALAVGDAQDNFLAWYDPSELPFLVELL